MYDAIIVGAGPAGLSAALILGRCCRRVLVCDAGHPRNAASQGLNGFLTRDGVKPLEMRRIGREQLGVYETVEIRDVPALNAQRLDERNFEVTMADGAVLRTRKLLLATGVADQLPEIAGFEEFYGRSIFHCPYCDGWEVRKQPLAVYGRGQHGKGLALELTAWSRDLVLCTDGPIELEFEDQERLARNSILVREEKLSSLEGSNGMLQRIHFVSGEPLARRAMFFSTGHHQMSELAARLGCDFTPKGAVNTGPYETTSIPGLYVAGDASRRVELTIVAAAEGAEAAFAINTQLLKEDLL